MSACAERLGLMSLLVVAVLPPDVNAQQHAHHVAATTQHPGAPAFLVSAKEGTRRYQSLDSAIADGYRRLGGDLPSMGEHWVHPARVMFGRLDAARPSILIYVRSPTGPTLAGIAYTTVLARGAPYPEFPAGQEWWHEHNGTVDEETLPLGHAMSTPSTLETRVAILHAWVWIDNPRGVWTADNWMLPFVRAGLAPDSALHKAARALSLAPSGAVDHYARVIATTVGGDDEQMALARRALNRAATQVAEIRRGTGSRLSAVQAAPLAVVWDELWLQLMPETDDPRQPGMRRLHDALR